MAIRQRYLRGLSNALCRQPWMFLLGAILLAAAAVGVTAWRLEFKTSRNDLIGRDSDYWRHFSEYAREFGAEEDYIVVAEGPQPERNRQAVDAFVAALLAPANNPHPRDHRAAQSFTVDDVYYHVDFRALEPWFLYYLTTAELAQIRDTIGDFKQLVAFLQQRPKLDTFFDAMNQMLAHMETTPVEQRGPMLAFLPTITGILEPMSRGPAQPTGPGLLSPWATAFFSEEMVGAAREEMRWNGYQVFHNGEMYIALVHPRRGGDTLARQTATVPKLRRIIAEVQPRFPEVTLSLTGEIVLDFDEMRHSQHDATKATVVTLVLCGLIFVFGFHEWIRPLLATFGILLVVALSLGWATVSVGHLNLITITFAVMIIGLGIDLSIQFIARYEEELNRGATRVDAVARAIEHTGPSIVTAALTNAAAFFAMSLSGFRGVTELGIIAGGGMILAMAVTMLVLPALLLVARRKQESTHIPAQAAASRAEQALLRRPGITLAVCATVTAVALYGAWRVKFAYNVLDLQSRGLESVETELRLLQADAESTIFGSVVCETFAETRALHHQLAALPTVATVHSIAELIPEDAEEKMVILREIQAKLGDVRFTVPAPAEEDAEAVLRSLASLRLRASQLARHAAGDPRAQAVLTKLAEAAREARTRLSEAEPAARAKWLAEYERQFFADLESQLQLIARQNVTRPMQLEDVPAEVRRMLIGQSGKFLIRVFPRENIWEREPLARFVRDLQRVAPKVTGTPLGLFEFVELLKRGYRNAALWALLVITIMIYADFRGCGATVLTIVPLLVGMAWMLGGMVLLDIPFNPANIMTLPLIVGIGVAYGIYVVQRYRETGEATFWGKSTGRAVILSGLTTIVAFASLIFGVHRGIRSLGVVMSLGVTACLVAAMTLLPALLEVARRKGWKV